MGIYLNPGNYSFKEAVNSQIYVDKSCLIEEMNQRMNTTQKHLCVSRPRRFGKSTDANMLVAYYSKGCDSKDLFSKLKISQSQDFEKYLNQYNVIHLNMQDFLTDSGSVKEMLERITSKVIKEATYKYSPYCSENLSDTLYEIFARTDEQFIFIIDEWDCVLREKKGSKNEQVLYLDFLRRLLKDKPYVALAYMTGILPIKKYGTHSALNMFDEISMINAVPLECYMGFTEEEVQSLCKEYDVDFSKMKEWYDGYHLGNDSLYSPKSVTSAVLKKRFDNYWSQTETYEALKIYIDMNFDGLKEAIIAMLAGERAEVDTTSFQNDMSTFESKDDVLTLLIHLGYLGYDFDTKKAYITNKEVMDSFVSSIKRSHWHIVTQTLMNSQALLEATWHLEADKVAQCVENAHLETSILQYNDENALSYTIGLAYIVAKNHYTMIRELPSGNGFADIVFIPKTDKPAMVVELKWNKDANTAISQIKRKKYMFGLEQYQDNLLLVGISYDKDSKKHTCLIERYRDFQK